MERATPATGHTWDDFVRLPEDDRRELVDGALLEVDGPTKWHERIVAVLVRYLDAWASTRGLIVLASGYKVRIGRQRGAMPDIQILTEAAYASADDQGLAHGRPELVVEVVSPGSRAHDRVRKLQWYASIGVPDYWIVDPMERRVDRLVLKAGTYDVLEVAEGEVTFRPRRMRGLAIPLGELWRALEPAKRPARKRRPPARR